MSFDRGEIRHEIMHIVLHPAKSMPLRVDGQIVIATPQVVYEFFRNAVELEFKPTIRAITLFIS
ncbi:conserved hypothetical protein [Cupriavidus taiwanensis]|uniref:Uncharacterized protein n=1 Tax=Cupriavidus taiwanensis TaxID=164546 RepID=A0A375JAR5_9BURK|nr:conserved hypothetical protein [Cupriavidus taiwanensis]